ncbi:hypothetical protein NQZ79_g1315 [Umbelopsis isabellina]|nr:hypothetical protein NQZ79_g1315 [Umbelopsis isabellina]
MHIYSVMAALGIAMTTLLRIDLYRRGTIRAKDDAWVDQYYIPDPNEKISIDHGLGKCCGSRTEMIACMQRVDIAAATLERLRARGDCFQDATTSLQHGCNAIHTIAVLKVQCNFGVPNLKCITSIPYVNSYTTLDAVALTDCELRTANHSLPTICTTTSDEQLLLGCVSSLAQVPQWWTSYSELLQRLHQNITANQLINYEILRHQQKEMLQKRKHDQDFVERLQKIQAVLENSLKENNSQNHELAHAQMQVQSLALTIAQLTDQYGHLAEQLVDTAVKQVMDDLALYTNEVFDQMDSVWTLYKEVEGMLQSLEGQQIDLLQNLNTTIAQANLAIHNMTVQFGIQLQQTWQDFDGLPFKLWSTLFPSNGLVSLLVTIISAVLTWLTPMLVLVQGIRIKYAVSLLSAVWSAAWLGLSRDTFACIMVFILKEMDTFSASEIAAWFWTIHTAHSICSGFTAR